MESRCHRHDHVGYAGPSDAVLLMSVVSRSGRAETDSGRIAARQRQLDMGIHTRGFQNLSAALASGKLARPRVSMPNKFQLCTKRAWMASLRAWRRYLHVYDGDGCILLLEAAPLISGGETLFAGDICCALGVCCA